LIDGHDKFKIVSRNGYVKKNTEIEKKTLDFQWNQDTLKDPSNDINQKHRL